MGKAIDNSKTLCVWIDNMNTFAKAYNKVRKWVIITIVKGEFTIKDLSELLTLHFGDFN